MPMIHVFFCCCCCFFEENFNWLSGLCTCIDDDKRKFKSTIYIHCMRNKGVASWQLYHMIFSFIDWKIIWGKWCFRVDRNQHRMLSMQILLSLNLCNFLQPHEISDVMTQYRTSSIIGIELILQNIKRNRPLSPSKVLLFSM